MVPRCGPGQAEPGRWNAVSTVVGLGVATGCPRVRPSTFVGILQRYCVTVVALLPSAVILPAPERYADDRRRRPFEPSPDAPRDEPAHARRRCAHGGPHRRRGARTAHRRRRRHRPAARHVGRDAPRGARDDQRPGVLAHRRPVGARAPRAGAGPVAAARREQRLASRVPEGVRRPREQRRQPRRVHGARARRPEPADQVGGAVGPVRLGHLPARHEEALGCLVERRDRARTPRRLRDDRDRARLRRGIHRHHRDVRPRDRGVRHQHAVPRRVEGLPRQRRAARARRHGVRAAHHGRRELRRALLLRADPRRRGRHAPRHPERRRRRQGRPQRHRQRTPRVRPRARAPLQPAEPLRRRGIRRHLFV